MGCDQDSVRPLHFAESDIDYSTIVLCLHPYQSNAKVVNSRSMEIEY